MSQLFDPVHLLVGVDAQLTQHRRRSSGDSPSLGGMPPAAGGIHQFDVLPRGNAGHQPATGAEGRQQGGSLTGRLRVAKVFLAGTCQK